MTHKPEDFESSQPEPQFSHREVVSRIFARFSPVPIIKNLLEDPVDQTPEEPDVILFKYPKRPVSHVDPVVPELPADQPVQIEGQRVESQATLRRQALPELREFLTIHYPNQPVTFSRTESGAIEARFIDPEVKD